MIDKLDLIEGTLSMQIKTNAGQESEQLFHKLEITDLHIHYVENRVLSHMIHSQEENTSISESKKIG